MDKVKKTYSTPMIGTVLLDNVISLALESTPAIGPGEGDELGAIQHSPYKTNNGLV